MKMLKVFAIMAVCVATLSANAATTAMAKLKIASVEANASYILTQDDAVANDFSSANCGEMLANPDDYAIFLYTENSSKKYSSVELNDIDGLTITFKPNAYETDYTLTISDVEGGIKVMRGEEEVVSPYEMTGITAPVTFTIVMPAAPAADYTRSVTSGNWGTICLPNASESFTGMALYTVAGYVADMNAIALDPMATEQMVAGMPYFFLASADMIEVNYTGDAAAAQEGANHLVGVLDEDGIIVSGLSYIVKDNLLWKADGAHVAANRAYIDLVDIADMDAPATSAPGRKFIAAPKAMPTGMQEVKAMNGARKAMVNGRLVIIREGRMFDALGAMK